MAITAYTGLPRNGKSYGVVENVILPAIKAGRTVYTNIPMVEEKWIELYERAPIQITFDEIQADNDFWNNVIEKGSIVVLDEVWDFWPSGTATKNIRDCDKVFFAKHGHMVGENGLSIEIILVTQDLADVAVFARNKVETTFRVTKLTKVGADKKFRVDIYSGVVTGQKPPVSQKENEIYGTFKQSVCDLYVSHTMSDSEFSGHDTRVDSRFNVFSRWKFVLYFAFLLIIGYYLFYTYKRFSTAFSGEDEELVLTNDTRSLPGSVQPVEIAKLSNFLDDVTSITIVSTSGDYPFTRYKFKAISGNDFFYMNSNDLLTMGYKLTAFNPCFVELKNGASNYYIGCYSNKRSRSALTNTFEGITGG